MKIYDCFTFFNELDLLEFRLKLLNDHVDYFVIAESNLTHSGKPKSYHFEENKSRFAPWMEKIIYIPVAQSAEGLVLDNNVTTYTPENASWKLENEQRNALSQITGLTDEDLVLVSDLDEIPDPTVFKKLQVDKSPVSLSMLFHYYFFNCQNTGRDRWWNGTIVANGKQFKAITPQGLRDKRNDYPLLKKGGWHFSYLGGLESIKYKIRSFAHTEYNKEEYLQDDFILNAIENGHDIFKRPDVTYSFVSVFYYPANLRKIMMAYPSFLHLKNNSTSWQKVYYAVKHFFN
jgi:beta-1,4-mannosyl-glycoprotein beta-1,4-N-acetylglucosaminyltransferase